MILRNKKREWTYYFNELSINLIIHLIPVRSRELFDQSNTDEWTEDNWLVTRKWLCFELKYQFLNKRFR